jgi:hypothetical protein
MAPGPLVCRALGHGPIGPIAQSAPAIERVIQLINWGTQLWQYRSTHTLTIIAGNLKCLHNLILIKLDHLPNNVTFAGSSSYHVKLKRCLQTFNNILYVF